MKQTLAVWSLGASAEHVLKINQRNTTESEGTALVLRDRFQKCESTIY